MRYRALAFIPVLCAAPALVHAAEPTLLDQGYRQMYNLQFEAAHKTFAEWQSLHPQDPMGPVSDAAAFLFSEFDRLHILQSEFFTHDKHFITDHKLQPDPAVKKSFHSSLETARRMASVKPNEPNSMFATILCSGLESDYLALIEKRYGASFQQMKASRLLAERLLAADPSYYDAWIAIGVENYMLSLKPLPIRWLLRLGGGQTDRSVGIEKLQLTAEKGRYLSPFAKLLLAVAALRDSDTKKAKELLTWLCREFPHNPLYRQELTRIDPLAYSPIAR
jgi:hypothetical protein